MHTADSCSSKSIQLSPIEGARSGRISSERPVSSDVERLRSDFKKLAERERSCEEQLRAPERELSEHRAHEQLLQKELDEARSELSLLREHKQADGEGFRRQSASSPCS
jgi:chromosome segregation ATPase